MLRLFHAGLVAALAQTLAVTAATVAITFALRWGLLTPALGAAESELQSVVRLLGWIDLLLAIGIALTRNRFIDETAGRIREAARRFYPPAPDRACKALFIQLAATSAGLAVLALRPPPGFLIVAADTWGWGPAVSLIWPGVISVGVAAATAPAMIGRKPRMLVAIALANKMARSIWAMLTKGEDYRVPVAATL